MSELTEPRGRTQERGRLARRRVLEAALEIITERPVSEIQVQQIAERAGMSPARVLYYFQSRDQILAETFRWSERDLAERRAGELAAVTAPAARLAVYIRLYLPEDRHDPSWKLWLEAWLRSTSASEMSRTADAIDSGWTRDLTAIVADGVADGTFRAVRAEEFLPTFNALLDGLAVHVLIGRLGKAQAVEAALAEAAEKLGGLDPS
ncbi:TetR/AcrR family transcriptional regulator [Nonomuraea endophytica]|uniref:AcrR family transcriptional regulator n=1 Tax=Nonomuraea endophytica TaxID=714136 RepID=A0A7W8A488_9ACTN|nr:TetR/AcrR family transcriptional regulator [Nonomuraea endophytica]MBB5079306.1 AcrR family transcriptional regulator [Nonomuraea endophytica]